MQKFATLWIRVALGLVLITAGFSKAINIRQLGNMDAISFVVLGRNEVALLVVSSLEGLLGVLLILGVAVRVLSAVFTLAFVLGLVLVTYWLLSLGEVRHCGCFGQYSSDTGLVWVYARHLILIFGAAFLWWRAKPDRPLRTG